MRVIDSIWIHCSATKPSMDVGVSAIRRWHTDPKPVGQGWSDIGYHFVIKRNGRVQRGRGISRMGAHTRGYNATSVGICLVGGTSEDGRPQFNFTMAQIRSLYDLVLDLQIKYEIPGEHVRGHNEVSRKACPTCDVSQLLGVALSTDPGKRDRTDREGF